MNVVHENPAGVPLPARNAYSNTVRVDVGTGALLFVAGQVSMDDEGNLVGAGDMTKQTQRTFDILSRILASNGATFDDVVSVRTFLTDIDLIEQYIEARRPYLTGELPASTGVEVSRLFHPDALLEVELVAAIPHGRS